MNKKLPDTTVKVCSECSLDEDDAEAWLPCCDAVSGNHTWVTRKLWLLVGVQDYFAVNSQAEAMRTATEAPLNEEDWLIAKKLSTADEAALRSGKAKLILSVVPK